MPSTFGLKFKLTLLIESLIVVLVLSTGIITTIRERKTLENELYKRGLALAADLAKFATRPLLSKDLPTLRRFVNHSMEQDYVRYAMILDMHGKIVMHNDLREVGKLFENRVALADRPVPGTDPVFSHLPEQSELHCDLAVPIEVDGARLGTVRLGYSYMAVEQEIVRARQQISMIGFFTIVIGGVVAYFLATFISAPIRRITAATERVADGDLEPALAVNRSDEIGALAKSFNRMAQELGKHRRHLQSLVADRTVALEATNARLSREIVERRSMQEKLSRTSERLRELALHLQSVREDEAKRIAREIHDELGQALTALKIDLHWLDSRLSADPAQLHAKLNKMADLIDLTIRAVRRISTELRPGLLDDFGLSAAMEWQANEFSERFGIPCRFVSAPETIVLDQDRSVALFRIFQEALTNIARHASATAVSAFLNQTGRNIRLTIEDNGIGISEKQTQAAGSFGVIGMHERVNALGGHLTIHGIHNKGTTVTVAIPKGDTGC